MLYRGTQNLILNSLISALKRRNYINQSALSHTYVPHREQYILRDSNDYIAPSFQVSWLPVVKVVTSTEILLDPSVSQIAAMGRNISFRLQLMEGVHQFLSDADLCQLQPCLSYLRGSKVAECYTWGQLRGYSEALFNAKCGCQPLRKSRVITALEHRCNIVC